MASIALVRAAPPRAPEIVARVGDEEDPIEAIGRRGARLTLRQALEEELTETQGGHLRRRSLRSLRPSWRAGRGLPTGKVPAPASLRPIPP
jgi:hypothetical protein